MQIIAHRGASGYAPENTESSIRLAAAQGATWIEFDIRLTKDHVIVLMHDSELDRTTNGTGKVIDHTFEQLQRLDCGRWFSNDFRDEKILSFTQLITLCQRLNLFMQVELKPDSGYEEALAKAIKLAIGDDPSILNQCLFSSFNNDALIRLMSYIPQAKTAILVEKISECGLDVLRANQQTALHFWHKHIDAALIKKYHEAGITTRCYTVNDEDEARILQRLGVSAIFTDYPDKMLALSW